MFNFKYLDLFSGIGGFSYALKKLGGVCVGYSEIEKNCKRTYELNFKGVRNLGGVQELDVGSVGEVDLIAGGTPCQPFSKLGENAGLKDPRGQLSLRFAEVVSQIKPKAFVMENVPNLIRSHKNDYKQILSRFGSGYKIIEVVADAREYGRTPQVRKRLFVVGVLEGEAYWEDKHLVRSPSPQIRDILDNVAMAQVAPEKLEISLLKCCDIRVGSDVVNSWVYESESVREKIEGYFFGDQKMPPKTSVPTRDKPPTHFATHMKRERYFKEPHPAAKSERLSRIKNSFPLMGIRLKESDKPIYRVYMPWCNEIGITASKRCDIVCTKYLFQEDTVKKNFIDRIYPGGFYRFFTPMDCKLLMGFPKDFIITGSEKQMYRQIGNSVVPLVVEKLCRGFSFVESIVPAVFMAA